MSLKKRSSPAPIDTATLKSVAAYDQLRHMIMSFELRTGQAVSERLLETHVGASRTAVRAAIARLEAEGLVRREGRSYIVTPIEPDEIEAAHDFLIALEAGALRQARPNGLAERLDALEKIVRTAERSNSLDVYVRSTMRFHEGLIELTGNPFFKRANDDAQTRIARAAWLTAWLTRERRADWSEHHRILDLMRRGRREDAVGVLIDLLTVSRAEMSRLVREDRRGLLARGIAIGGG
jgi:DNA-binding GntR family transcriptional regulator